MAADKTEPALGPPMVCVIRPDDLPEPQCKAALEGAAAAEADVATQEITGPAVEAPGPHGFVYGAVLTPKGMIISDMWVGRRDAAMTLFPPLHGREVLGEVFKRFLPPRLASVNDKTAEFAVIRLVGPHAIERMVQGRIQIPEPGRQRFLEIDGVPCTIARPAADQPFGLQVTTPKTEVDRIEETLDTCGITIASGAALELARIVAGWPRLGAEIDAKTLPQEVRFDEINGVSYSKGCYTGQETVARIHFRGHTNRHLIGLHWTDGEPDPDAPEIYRGEKIVGRVTSAAWSSHMRPIGLGVVRRDVGASEAVSAARAPALTVELPS